MVDQFMHHYTYCTHFTDDTMYIGVRSCSCPVEEDVKYIGSSKVLPKHLYEFKEILQIFPTRKEALAHEIELHQQFDVARNPKFHNQVKQTSTGFDAKGGKLSPEHIARIKAALTGRVRSERERAAMRIGARKRVHFPMSEATKAKLSLAKLGKPNPRSTHSLEQRIQQYASRADHTLYLWVHKKTGESITDSAWGMGNRFIKTSSGKKRANRFTSAINPNSKDNSYLGWFPHSIPTID